MRKNVFQLYEPFQVGVYNGIEVIFIKDGHKMITFDLFTWQKMDGIYYDEMILEPHYEIDESLKFEVNTIIQINKTNFAVIIGKTDRPYWNLIAMDYQGDIIYLNNSGITMNGAAEIVGCLK